MTMTDKKHGFFYKMTRDLTYRMLTAVLVCILPVCIIGCILLGIVWNRTQQEMQRIEQDRLTDAMAYWERDCSVIDDSMEYFVFMFLEELNNDSSQLSPTVHRGISPHRPSASAQPSPGVCPRRR